MTLKQAFEKYKDHDDYLSNYPDLTTAFCMLLVPDLWTTIKTHKDDTLIPRELSSLLEEFAKLCCRRNLDKERPEVAELIRLVREALGTGPKTSHDLAKQILAEICVWVGDGDNAWATSCGELYEFYEGGPVQNGFKGCPYCLKPLVEKPYINPAIEDKP
jgi:hypothetical protein